MLNLSLAFDTLKTQNNLVIASRLAHWNVRGPNFYESHLLFGRIYDSAGEKTDTLVEVLRPMGYSPTFEEFAGPGGNLGSFLAPELVSMLMEYCAAYYTALVKLREASKNDDMLIGLVNLLEQLCEDANGIMFLLAAAQGG